MSQIIVSYMIYNLAYSLRQAETHLVINACAEITIPVSQTSHFAKYHQPIPVVLVHFCC